MKPRPSPGIRYRAWRRINTTAEAGLEHADGNTGCDCQATVQTDMARLVVGAVMKIGKDLLLWRAFREVQPPEEAP